MKIKSSVSAIALACAIAVAGTGLANAADALIDTSKLPRANIAKEVYASPATTIYTSTESVAATAEATRKLLGAQGWQSYEPPFTSKEDNPSSKLMTLKKGSQGLTAFITVATGQNNATSVQYTVRELETDLPFPKDAANVEFSAQRPYLKCLSEMPVEAALAFFGAELTSRGWSAWSTKDVAKIPPGEKIAEANDKGTYVYFVRDGKPPVRLYLALNVENRTVIELLPIPPADLNPQAQKEAALAAKAKEDARMARAQEEAKARFAKRSAEFDARTDDIMKKALSSAREAMNPPKPPVAPTTTAVNEAPILALANSPAPVPLPETADEIDYKGENGRLEFKSASSVPAIAEFFRASMKPLGWREEKSVINKPTMVVLDFEKDRQKVSFTVMQMGATANVSGHGSGLINKAAVAAAEKAAEAKAEAAGDRDLEAEDKSGLPVPKESTLSGSSVTPYRIEANATVTANIASVVAFYRRELAKKNWTEDARAADVKPNRVVLKYAAPEGPALLTIDRKGTEAEVILGLSKKEDAAKSGLLPKPGQVKILVSSMLESESVRTLNKKTIKVGGGVGMKAPDGPTLELPPGKYKVLVKNGSKPASSSDIDVGADAIWGLIVGPGGVLPLRVY
jgi:hypothetical protein